MRSPVTTTPRIHLDPDRLESVRDSVDRLLGTLVAAGVLLLAVQLIPALWRDIQVAPWWWLSSSTVLLLGFAIVGAGGRWIRPATLRLLWRMIALGGLLMTVSWAFEAEDPDWTPWIYVFISALVGAAVMSWRWRGALVYTVVLATLLPVLELLGAVGLPADSWVAAPFLQLTNVGFLAILQGIRYQLIRHRTALELAVQQRAKVARAEAALAERTAVAAIIHDDVLSALYAIAGPDRNSMEAAIQARDALTALDARVVTDDRRTALVDQLRVLTKEVLPEADLILPLPAVLPEPEPGVAAALVAATGEALRNVRRHVLSSHADSRCVVDVDGDPDRITIDICDDGPGFDTDVVDPRRLGLRDSIHSRMAAIPGCASEVSSAPGHGTRVRLEWIRPKEPPTLPFDTATAMSGFGSTATRVTMVVVWAAFCLHLATGPDPLPWFQVVALGLLLVATLLVTADRPEPLADGLAWCVAGFAGSALVFSVGAGIPTGHGPTWIISLAGYQLAFVAVRGRAKVAWTALGASVVVLVVLTLATGGFVHWTAWFVEMLPSSTIPVSALVLGSLWRMILVRAERRTAEAEQDRAEHLTAENRARERIRTRVGELNAAAELAADLLSRARDGALVEEDAGTARLVEAMVRDRLRAPRLSVPELIGTVREARGRGAEIVLLDDGDRSAPLSPAHMGRIASRIRDSGAGSRVTVRLLPPGRQSTGTVAVSGSAAAALERF